MWIALMWLLNMFTGGSGLARMFAGCHGGHAVVSTFIQQSEDQHMLDGVFIAMLCGGAIEISMISYRRMRPKTRAKRSRKPKGPRASEPPPEPTRANP